VADYDAHAAETCGDEAALKSAIDASREIRRQSGTPEQPTCIDCNVRKLKVNRKLEVNVTQW